MEQELMDILTDLRPDVDFETETALIDDHILESFDIVSLVAATSRSAQRISCRRTSTPPSVCWPWCSACRTRTDGQDCTPDGSREIRHATVSV